MNKETYLWGFFAVFVAVSVVLFLAFGQQYHPAIETSGCDALGPDQIVCAGMGGARYSPPGDAVIALLVLITLAIMALLGVLGYRTSIRRENNVK